MSVHFREEKLIISYNVAQIFILQTFRSVHPNTVVVIAPKIVFYHLATSL